MVLAVGAVLAGLLHHPFRLDAAITACSFAAGAVTGPLVLATTVVSFVVRGQFHADDIALLVAHAAAVVAGLTLLRQPTDAIPRPGWAPVRIAGLVALAFTASAAQHLIAHGDPVPSTGRWTFTALGLAAGLLLAAATSWRPQRNTGSLSTFGMASIALVTASSLLFTVLFWVRQDERLLHVTADATVVGLLNSLSENMNVVSAKAATSTVTSFTADTFPSLVRSTVFGHDAINAAVLARLGTDGRVTVLSQFSASGEEFDAAVAAWVEGRAAALTQAVDAGGLTYLDVTMLPLPTGGVQPHLMYAAPLADTGAMDGGQTLLVAGISLPSLVGAAAAPTLAATGEAVVQVYLCTDNGVVPLWSTGGNASAETAAPLPTLSPQQATPTDTVATRALTTFTLGGVDFDLTVDRGVDFGSPLGFRRVVLLVETLSGLLLLGIVFTRGRHNASREIDRVRREALLAAALEGAPGWTAIIDDDDRVVMANHGAHGLGAGELLADMALWAGDEETTANVLQLASAARAGTPGSLQHVWTDPADHTHAIRIFEVEFRPLPAAAMAYVQCVDVTEHRDRAMRTAQSERMEAIGVLAGGLAHDFNNLLFITLGYLQMLQRQQLITDNPQAGMFVSRAIEAVDRGAVVARSLLSFARSQPLTAVPLNLREFLDGLAPLVEQGLGSAHTLSIATRSDAALDVVVDPGRLSSSLLNIVFNARDAMDGPGRLDIVVHRDLVARTPDSEPEDMVAISVTDTGRGIAPDVLARVFEPFFTTKKVGSGTGLGLATVYSFAQQSGGWTAIESTEGIGTTVSIHLPPALGAQRPAEVAPITLRPATRVLVVDDEPALADLVAGWLESFGMQTKVAYTPQVALQLADEFEPELLVSDANLNDPIDGLELARILVQHDPGLLVVFMTGFSERIKALQRAGVATLAKPFSSDDLYAVLTTHLGERLAAGHSPGGLR